jgi:hypothetical protein
MLTVDGTWYLARYHPFGVRTGRVSFCPLYVTVLMRRFPIPVGDLREMKPFLIVNTGLRRLGCGGRAAMGTDSPM